MEPSTCDTSHNPSAGSSPSAPSAHSINPSVRIVGKRKVLGRPLKPVPGGASNLRLVRRGAGLTQKEVARAVGVTQSTISLVERGDNKRLGREKWFLLSDLLGCDVKWLHGRDGETYKVTPPSTTMSSRPEASPGLSDSPTPD